MQQLAVCLAVTATTLAFTLSPTLIFPTPVALGCRCAVRAVDNASASMIDAVSDVTDATQMRMQDAANTATGAVDDAAQAAEATITSAAATASNIVSDAADTTAAFVNDADVAFRAAADSMVAAATPGGPIDWSVGVGATPDARFKGMKVLVVGATGGVGR